MHAVFDVDSTLATPANKYHVEAYAYAIRKYFGIEVMFDIHSMQGMIDQQILFAILRQHSVSESEILANIGHSMKSMGEYFLEQYRLMDQRNESLIKGQSIKEIPDHRLGGAMGILRYLKKCRVSVCVLTGNIESICWARLERLKLKEYISVGAFGDEALERYLLVELVRERLAKKLDKNIKVNELVIIGDTVLDIACAKKAGAKSIGVATGGFTQQQLKAAGADLVVSNLTQGSRPILKFLGVKEIK